MTKKLRPVKMEDPTPQEQIDFEAEMKRNVKQMNQEMGNPVQEVGKFHYFIYMIVEAANQTHHVSGIYALNSQVNAATFDGIQKAFAEKNGVLQHRLTICNYKEVLQ